MIACARLHDPPASALCLSQHRHLFTFPGPPTSRFIRCNEQPLNLQNGAGCKWYSVLRSLRNLTIKKLRLDFLALLKPEAKLLRNWGSLFPTARSEPDRMSGTSCARQRARSSTFIVSESLFPIKSRGESCSTVQLLPQKSLLGY